MFAWDTMILFTFNQKFPTVLYNTRVSEQDAVCERSTGSICHVIYQRMKKLVTL